MIDLFSLTKARQKSCLSWKGEVSTQHRDGLYPGESWKKVALKQEEPEEQEQVWNWTGLVWMTVCMQYFPVQNILDTGPDWRGLLFFSWNCVLFSSSYWSMKPPTCTLYNLMYCSAMFRLGVFHVLATEARPFALFGGRQETAETVPQDDEDDWEEEKLAKGGGKSS